MNEWWLSCTISPGQFSDEFAVSGRDHRGHGFSLFAPEHAVVLSDRPSVQPVRGFMRVELVESRESLQLVRLPARTMENGDLITVSKEQLTARPPNALASR